MTTKTIDFTDIFDAIFNEYSSFNKKEETSGTRSIDNGTVLIEMPGFTKDQIVIEEGPKNTLIIKAAHTKPGNYVHSSITKTIALFENDDVSRITASLENGILTVKIPKKEKVEPKKIRINVT
jgi:HSP20 family molecular chaperone IbpA